jgi:DNA-binding beta-propeller fold protein YncE
VDARSRRFVGALEVPGTPLGVVVPPSGKELFVSRFDADRILRFRIGGKEPIGHVVTGGAPSLLVGPYPGGKARIPVGEIPIVMAVHPSGETLWVSSEGSHEVSVIEIPKRWRFPP